MNGLIASSSAFARSASALYTLTPFLNSFSRWLRYSRCFLLSSGVSVSPLAILSHKGKRSFFQVVGLGMSLISTGSAGCSGSTVSSVATSTLSSSDTVSSLATNCPFSLRAGYRDWETDRKSTRLNSSHRL